MNQIRLFNILRKEMHLSDASAEDAVSAMQELTGFAFDSKINLLATKEDMSALKIEINSLKKDIQTNKDDLYKAICLSGFLQFIANDRYRSGSY